MKAQQHDFRNSSANLDSGAMESDLHRHIDNVRPRGRGFHLSGACQRSRRFNATFWTASVLSWIKHNKHSLQQSQRGIRSWLHHPTSTLVIPLSRHGAQSTQGWGPGPLQVGLQSWFLALGMKACADVQYMSGLEEAVLRNIAAVGELTEIVRTSFGPNGVLGPSSWEPRAEICRSE